MSLFKRKEEKERTKKKEKRKSPIEKENSYKIFT